MSRPAIWDGVTVEMHLAKSTAGTHVYQEPSDKPRDSRIFPTIYVQKGALTDPPPATLVVTIRAK